MENRNCQVQIIVKITEEEPVLIEEKMKRLLRSETVKTLADKKAEIRYNKNSDLFAECSLQQIHVPEQITVFPIEKYFLVPVNLRVWGIFKINSTNIAGSWHNKAVKHKVRRRLFCIPLPLYWNIKMEY